MQLVKVPENRVDEMLDEFFMTCAFTFEGLDVKHASIYDLEKLLINNGYDVPENKRVWYYFSGSVMNKKYQLTGDNAYPDDLTIVVIPGYYNPFIKLQLGARWFDDVVDNNLRREREKYDEQE